MKPNWGDSPSWARYLAMDANGAWWWYANKPIIWNSEHSDEWQPNGGSCNATVVGSRWKESL